MEHVQLMTIDQALVGMIQPCVEAVHNDHAESGQAIEETSRGIGESIQKLSLSRTSTPVNCKL